MCNVHLVSRYESHDFNEDLTSLFSCVVSVVSLDFYTCPTFGGRTSGACRL